MECVRQKKTRPHCLKRCSHIRKFSTWQRAILSSPALCGIPLTGYQSGMGRSSSSSSCRLGWFVASKPSKLQSEKNGSSIFKVDRKEAILSKALSSLSSRVTSCYHIGVASRGVSQILHARSPTAAQPQTDRSCDCGGAVSRERGRREGDGETDRQTDRCLRSQEFIISVLPLPSRTATWFYNHGRGLCVSRRQVLKFGSENDQDSQILQ